MPGWFGTGAAESRTSFVATLSEPKAPIKAGAAVEFGVPMQ